MHQNEQKKNDLSGYGYFVVKTERTEEKFIRTVEKTQRC